MSRALPSAARHLLLAVVAVAGGLALALWSEPRRVGDGVEYWAMASQMASGRLPAPTAAELTDLARRARVIGHGFDRSPLAFPGLVGADGRQDFPHFWLYPAVVAPVLALVDFAGLHPAWAFTIANLLLVGVAWAIVSSRSSASGAALVLAGPLIWWIDKAHGDVFTVSLLAMGCALWVDAPAAALLVAAPAAAQNPALMPVWTVWALLAAWRVRADPDARARTVVAILAGGAILALPLAYYRWHLGTWSPLMHYVHPGRPSVRAMLTLLLDPNVGLLPNAPFACAAAVALCAARDGRGLGRSGGAVWMMAGSALVLLLVSFAQSVNLNHGATPGMNRWTLWLVPMLLVFAALPVNRAPGRRAASITVLALLNVAWGVWYFRPSLPEVYRYPTRVAAWLWTVAPGVYQPAPEIFAERASHREPAQVPAAWPGCTLVLIENGSWPAPCVPSAATPRECRGAGRLCYAVPAAVAPAVGSAAATSFTVLGQAAFPRTPARGWPADALFVAALRSRLAAMGADLAPAPDLVRATRGIGWTVSWAGGSRVAIYLGDVSASANLRVRVDADYAGELVDLDRAVVVTTIAAPRSGATPTVIAFDQPLRHGFIALAAR